jgi:2-polyprenyl-3-methyl-5-hydroxy-6-metoxy-1,4-benzoquinol methylase
MKCRYCGSVIDLTLVDLGSSPPSNAYLTKQTLHKPELWFPLRVMVCEQCWLVQTEDFADAHKLFNAEYAYFSSFSSGWLEHSKLYIADMVGRFGLNKNSHVVEIGANDGYLLQFVKARNIPCTGVEPTSSTAANAKAKGLAIVENFLSVSLAKELVSQGKQADLIIANNVLAHVPDINDFVTSFTILLKKEGVATFEFPHLPKLIKEKQFDTIYHEHFSYLSLSAVNQIFLANGLNVFDVEEYPTHGGSLRVFAQRNDTAPHPQNIRVKKLLELESQAGVNTANYYLGFQAIANQVRDDFITFLLDIKRQGKTVVAYGAAAKGNTLLNYSGIRPDLIPYVVDRNPSKQGKYLPGSRIPITTENRIKEEKPDYILILPWNIKDEVISQLAYVRKWGGKFVTAVPELEIKD